MRLSNPRSAICGTEKLVVEDIEIAALEVPIEDAEGNEGTFREDEWHIKVRPHERDARRCPECGRKCPGYDQQPPRAWRTVDVGTSRCFLHYAPMRVRCPVFNGTVNRDVLKKAMAPARPGEAVERAASLCPWATTRRAAGTHLVPSRAPTCEVTGERGRRGRPRRAGPVSSSPSWAAARCAAPALPERSRQRLATLRVTDGSDGRHVSRMCLAGGVPPSSIPRGATDGPHAL